MTPRILVALLVVVGLAGCGSRLNPMNWFGNDREEQIVVETPNAAPVDGRQLVTQIASLDVDPTPGGAIIRAVGLPPRQGYWEADLVEVSREDAELVFEFRIREPYDPATRVGEPRSREVYTATAVSRYDLSGIRTITVIGQQNRRSVRRR